MCVCPNRDAMAAIVWGFNVLTDIGACDCTRLGLHMDTVGKSALKVVSGEKIPCRTGASNVPLQY